MTTMEPEPSRREEMERKLQMNPEGWRPEPGEMITGSILDVDSWAGNFGSYPLLIVETDDGDEVSVHCFHTVLKNEIAKLRPMPGDYIGIIYHGKREGKGGGSYESYRVKLERSTSPPWEQIEEQARAEMEARGIDSMLEAASPKSVDDEIPY